MLLLLALLGCAPKVEAPAPSAAAASTATAPTPYTADQIRDAMPVGTHIRYALSGGGAPPMVMDWSVTAHTDAQMTMRTLIQDATGATVDDQGDATHGWEELRLHGAFPAAKTTRSEATTTVAAGTWPTLVYVVQDVTEEGMPVTATYHFAKDMAGPPILMVVNAADGSVVQRMELLSRAAGQ